MGCLIVAKGRLDQATRTEFGISCFLRLQEFPFFVGSWMNLELGGRAVPAVGRPTQVFGYSREGDQLSV